MQGFNRILCYGLVALATLCACSKTTEKRKIKVAAANDATEQPDQLTSTIYLEPTLRRAVAVMFFENKTGDENLAWLQKGLTEMFIRSLSQSQNLSVLSSERLYEILDRLGRTDTSKEINLDLAAVVAREANVETLLTGNISKNGDGIQINVKVLEADKGKILKEESAEGVGLEHIFSMVDSLTHRIESELRLTLQKDGTKKSIADITTTSLDAWRNYINGLNFLYQYRLPEAREQLEKAIQYDSTFIAAYIRLYNIYALQGSRSESDTAFQNLIRCRDNATAQEKYQINVLEAVHHGRLRNIMAVSHAWQEAFPNDREANFNLANSYFQMANYEQAINYYENVLRIDPNFQTAHNILGYAYAYIGQFDKAISRVEKYKQLSPEEPNPYDSLGEIYLYMGDFKRARENFKQAIRANENFVFSWIHLGETYFETGDYTQALECFHKATEMADDHVNSVAAHRALGMTQLRLGNREAAAASFSKYLDYQTNYYTNFTLVNDLYLSQNDTARANEMLEKNYQRILAAIETDPYRILDLANLGLWHNYKIRETIDVIQQTTQASNNEFANLWGRFLAALLAMKMGDSDDAQKISPDFAREFIEIINDVPDIRYNYLTWKGYLVFNQYAYRFKDEGIAKYNELIRYCQQNNLNMPEMVFRSFLADLYFQTGETEKANHELKLAGVPPEHTWLHLGPFENENGFSKQFPPEKKIDLKRSYSGLTSDIRWKKINDGFREGYINYKQAFPFTHWGVCYALLYIQCPTAKSVQMRLGSNESVKVWLNDSEVWRWNEVRSSIFDDDVVPVTLQPGMNKVLVKLCNRVGEWGFYFRVTDEQGVGLPDIAFVSPLEMN